jgi:serine/threonine-protein kinase
VEESHPKRALEARSPVRRGASNPASTIGLRFVQDRLALFGKTIVVFATVYLVMAVILSAAGIQPFFAPGRESHLISTALALALWLIARRRAPLSPSALAWLDGLGTVGVCVCVVVMGHRFAHLAGTWGNFPGTISVFHVVLARAVIVPSSPRRTLVITALSFASLVVSEQLLAARMDPTAIATLNPGMQMNGASRWLFLFFPLTLSGTGTGLATLASHVIYGLHREVREARQLGQYTLEEKIGEGGMGEVYRARHAMLRRSTAVKLLAGDVSERDLYRFEKEVQLTAELTHPNTISIYDYGRTADGTFYYAMELLDGLSLQQLVDEHGAQPAARVIHVLLQACAALREAHEAGLIHRDIKPENIFLCRRGGLPDVVKVLDFGLVKQVATDVSSSLSTVNTIVGTPLYMSPEGIATPDKVNAQSDLYALGAVAYFLLTGAPVFSGQSIVEICSHHLHSAPAPPSQRIKTLVPVDLERIVMDCLAKDPRQRPESAESLAARLRACADAGAWGEADAKRWWAAPRAKPRPAEAGVARTVAVTLEGRLDGVEIA